MRIVGLMLAAGKGERFGGDKLLAPLLTGPSRGQPLGAVSTLRLVDALPETFAIVRSGDTELGAALTRSGARIVECDRAEDGMAASLACGIAASRDADAWVVALADMPWIASSTLWAVIGALRAGASIAAPAFRGRRGHPVGFASRHGATLAGLTGDTGARDVLLDHAAAITLVAVNDAAILRDVDVPEDLAAEQQQQ